jgi:hypothetical protein
MEKTRIELQKRTKSAFELLKLPQFILVTDPCSREHLWLPYMPWEVAICVEKRTVYYNVELDE